jgi:K+-transporting ATPase KdpF subunit
LRAVEGRLAVIENVVLLVLAGLLLVYLVYALLRPEKF